MRVSTTGWQRHWIRAVLLSAITVLAVQLTGGMAAAAPGIRTEVPIDPLPVAVLPPELDPFYRAPATAVEAAAPGDILKARLITPAALNVIPMNVDAWQVLYRTNDSHGRAIATVTTLIKPRGPAPEGGRKLLSYQVAEDSTAMYCAPSYGIQQGSIPIFSDFVNMGEANLAVLEAVSNGYALSMPDYQGPNSAFGAAVIGGQATLDAMRAAIKFTPLELSAGNDTRIAALGYSGGSIPTGWLTEHAKDYAPELNIVGIGLGGVAMADLPAVIRQNNFNIGAGLIGGAFSGFATEYPGVKQVLETRTDWFTRFTMTVKSLLCHSPYGSATFPFWNYLGGYTGPEPGGILAEPAIVDAINDNALGKQRPTVPMYVYHAQSDELIPYAGTDRLIDWYCDDPGQSITYDSEYFAEHISGLLTWIPRAYNFVVDRLEDRPAQPGCRTNKQFSTLAEGDVVDLLVQKWPALAGLLTGQQVGRTPGR
ncbi:lipase family protein [Nocardia brasiliensis]|uniref:lipase family protein n=1 Tax=Nocardia brasiliensis TaxID=37326 RepID=UPI0002E8884E|nr:lipase family protein [Nocardia brasiliensis]